MLAKRVSSFIRADVSEKCVTNKTGKIHDDRFAIAHEGIDHRICLFSFIFAEGLLLIEPCDYYFFFFLHLLRLFFLEGVVGQGFKARNLGYNKYFVTVTNKTNKRELCRLLHFTYITPTSREAKPCKHSTTSNKEKKKVFRHVFNGRTTTDPLRRQNYFGTVTLHSKKIFLRFIFIFLIRNLLGVLLAKSAQLATICVRVRDSQFYNCVKRSCSQQNPMPALAARVIWVKICATETTCFHCFTFF